MRNPFRDLTHFELGLWLFSMAAIALSYPLSGAGSPLNLVASLLGVTALIFVAKGYVLGQVLTVVFALFYGVISFFFHYYGEMITYLGMTAPIAAMAVVSWARHPYAGTKEVEVARMSRPEVAFAFFLSALVTVLFYYILKALGTANLLVSTLSVTTSFLACYMAYKRSPFYGLGYAANDIILVVLWGYATLSDRSYLPMAVCFVMFLLNDLYGFVNWGRMKKRQAA